MCLQERNGRLHLLHRRREWGGERIIEEKAYDLGVDAAHSRVLHQAGHGADFWAYVDDGENLHYVSFWLPKKSRRLRLPRAQVRTLDIVSPYFARAGGSLFCRGVRVIEADPASFAVVPRTRFARDTRRVYAFTITEGLDKQEFDGGPLYFLPQCEYFADRRGFYHQSSWTNRIEPVQAEERISVHGKNAVLRACLWNGEDAADEQELAVRSTLMDRVVSVGDLFRRLLPGANAAWNRHSRAAAPALALSH